MATTIFFEKTIYDKEDKTASIDIEFGRSSFYDGENLMLFNIEGKSIIVDEATGRELYEALDSLASYLGYNRARP